ncbi:MAG: O-antigen ligase family protein [Pseudomonadota bacterium]
MKVLSQTYIKREEHTTGGFLFWIYIYFAIDFFLHLSARMPGYGVIRPTLLLVVIISVFQLLQWEKSGEITKEKAFRVMLWLLFYIVITLPLVTWPGSVLMQNIPAFVKAVVFFFFTALIVDTEKRLKLFLFVFILCQLIRVLEPLYLHITEGYWGDKTYLGHGEFAQRLSGAPSDVVNPNGLGFVIVTLIPYLYYLLWKVRALAYRLIFLGLMPALIYALVLTMSRGAFIAMLVVIWMLFKESSHKFGMLLILIASMMAVWVNLSDVHKERYLSLVSSDTRQSASAEGRIQGMKDEFIVALERPLIGHGLGTSREAKANADAGWLISHNLYLEILIEIGLVGLLIFFSFIKSIYRKFRQNREQMESLFAADTDTFIWRLNSALTAVFWMYIVYSINYFGLSAYYWYLFAGLTIAFSRIYFGSGEKTAAERVSHG